VFTNHHQELILILLISFQYFTLINVQLVLRIYVWGASKVIGNCRSILCWFN